MFELVYRSIEPWDYGEAAFRNLYRQFLMELINHPELKKGSDKWQNDDFSILKECILMINKLVQEWTNLARRLKNAIEKYTDDCLKHMDLNQLKNNALYIVAKEEQFFKNLSKIKI